MTDTTADTAAICLEAKGFDLEAIKQRAKDLQTLANDISARAWAIESALSMLRKAKAGYRSNPKLGDAPWDTTACERAVKVAYDASFPS